MAKSVLIYRSGAGPHTPQNLLLYNVHVIFDQKPKGGFYFRNLKKIYKKVKLATFDEAL